MKLFAVKRLVDRARNLVWNRFWGMSVHPTAQVSLQAKLDKVYPRGVVIKERCIVTFGATILTHDMTRRLRATTVIEADSFIGARSIILPGVHVGPNAIVAAGSVVTRDVEPGTIVAGNPARVIQSGVDIGPFGVLREAINHDGLIYDDRRKPRRDQATV